MSLKKSKKVYIALILLAVALIAGTVTVFAKYLQEYDSITTVQTPEFYFESDILTEQATADDVTTVYTLNSGVSEITFTLKNYPDDLRFSAVEVAYTLSVTGGTGATLSQSGGTLEKGQKSEQRITLSNLKQGESYTVIATSTNGYSKLLGATFVVKADGVAAYRHVDSSHDAYVLLTVWTENTSGRVFVDFPVGLIPDNTDPDMATVKTGDGCFTTEHALGAYSSHVYRFFKTAEYDPSSEFSVNVGDTVTVEGTPS